MGSKSNFEKCSGYTRVVQFRKSSRLFKSYTRPYLRLPSCRETKTASDSIKKSMQKRPNFILWGGWSCDFRPIEKWWIFDKTLMLHRSEPNFILNEKLDHSLSNQIDWTDISHPHPPYGSEREKLLLKLWFI